MNKMKAFFESYNMAMQKAYDKYFEIAEKDILRGMKEDTELLGRFLSEDIGKWEAASLYELDSLTPALYVDSLSDFNDILSLFQIGAVICDDSLPTIFLNKLKSFNESYYKLLELCSKFITDEDDEDSLLISQLAVKILGIWKLEKAIEPLIGLLYSESENSVLISENVKEALVSIGKPAIPKLIEYIETRGLKEEAGEYLLMALAEIGESHRSDEIYRCLKNSLSLIHNKAICVICLGNYGDGRAIPALRGFLEKNRGVIDKEVYYEVLSSIKKLGGNVDDLSFQ